MCGIGGYFGSRVISPESVGRMMAALRPRGPDAEHSVHWSLDLEPTSGAAPNGLLHTRLAIVDPRPQADQPMVNDAGDIWISYNGQVYDWAADAAALGVQFRTHSDTEFILRAYERWGIGCLPKLRGMFALGILDLRRRLVYVIRDRIGLKPVVYSHRNDGFAFASTVRALLPWLPRDARQLSPEGIDTYLAHRTILAPRTAFARISRLPAAHYLKYDLTTGDLTEHEYWRPEASTEPWLTTFDAAVRMRTVADRPLGLFLSSGIDSSVLASRLAAQGFSGMRSFTASFPGTEYDESTEAWLTSERLGFPNNTIEMPTELAKDFDQIVADLDEPFADPSAVPTWHLARKTALHVPVVIGGDGGDELFAGYKRYRKHLRTRWRRAVSLPSLQRPSHFANRSWQRLVEELRLDWSSAYVLRFSGLMPRERLYLEPDMAPRAHYWRMPPKNGAADLNTLLEIDRLNYLPEYILRKGDLCTMAHGLELRAPFLDDRVFNCTLGLPATVRFTVPPKKFLSGALAPSVDRGIFSRKKRGFNPPIEKWLAVDLAPRLPGLGTRLSNLTLGQLEGPRVAAFVREWSRDSKRLSEQLLLLLFLDESLRQLAAI